MLSHDVICARVSKIAKQYPVKKIGYFGSYAAGAQTERSDLDFAVEFNTPSISLLTLSEIKLRIEDDLKVPVDLVHTPLPEDSFIDIGKVVPVYER